MFSMNFYCKKNNTIEVNIAIIKIFTKPNG